MAIIYVVKTPEQILEASKKYSLGLADPVLTNWNFGSRIRILVQTFATMASQIMSDFYISLKRAIAVSVYDGFGFEKKAGTKSYGQIIFSRDEIATEKIIILEGTSITLDGIEYSTIEEGSIEIGDTDSLAIDCQSVDSSSDANISIGAIDTASEKGFFAVKPQGVDSATNPIPFSGGTNEETDSERIDRFQKTAQGLTTSTELGLLSSALAVEGVASATIRESSPEAGVNTIYIDDGSGNAPQLLIDEVQKVIDGDRTNSDNYPGKRGAGIRTIITVPVIKNIDITIEVRILVGNFSDYTDLIDKIKNEVIRKINVLPLGYDATRSLIVKTVMNISGYIYDCIVVLPATNLSAEENEVIRFDNNINTFTITVVEVNP